MKRSFTLLAALFLTLSLAGCKMPGVKPDPGVPTGSDPSVQSTTLPTAAAPTETQPKIKGVNVIDAFSKTEEFGISWSDETFICSFSIPAIDLDTDNAEAFNQTIYDDLYKVYEAAHDPEDDLIYSLNYVSSVYKGVVAILTDTEYMLPASEYMGHIMGTYYYDVATDRPLDSAEAYVNKLGYTLDQLEKAARQTREYQELQESGIYSGEEKYEWDSVTLYGCIINFDTVYLLFDCVWSFSAEGEVYTNHHTVVKAVDSDDFLGSV